MKVIKVGTRKSKLAMTQTQQLVDQLKALIQSGILSSFPIPQKEIA